MDTVVSAFQELDDFARRTNRQLVTEELSGKTVALHRVNYHQRWAYMGNRTAPTCWFAAFSDARKMNIQGNFSGLFFALPWMSPETITVQSRDILDRLNPFGGKSAFNTGVSYFDKQVRLMGNPLEKDRQLLSQPNVQEAILDTLKLDPALHAGINPMRVEFVPELKDRTIFGFYHPQRWMLDEQLLEDLFKACERVQELVRQ